MNKTRIRIYHRTGAIKLRKLPYWWLENEELPRYLEILIR